jgi:hypothetical protein
MLQMSQLEVACCCSMEVQRSSCAAQQVLVLLQV